MANILVCDDDKDIVSAIEIYLLEDSHVIYKAYDGYQALDILEKEDIFVEYLYSFVRPQDDDAMIVFKLSDPERAQEALERKGITILTEEQVCSL